MHIQNYILLLEAGLLFALAFYVLLRNPGQKIPQAFFVTSIGAGIWVISNAIFEITQSLIFGKTTFAGAILIVVGFYFLTNYFPYQYRRVSIFERYLVLAVAIILGIVLYTSNWFVTRVVSKDVLGFDIFYHIFAIYFVLIWLWSIYNLAIKYKMANGVHRLQIKYLFLAIIFSFFAGITTNLILPWIFDYQLFGWIGPSFTIVFFGFSAFILFEKKLK